LPATAAFVNESRFAAPNFGNLQETSDV